MNWTIVELVGQYALIALIVALGFALIMFIVFSILYMPSFLQKKINLKQAEDILQHNIEIVEKATFFETSTEFNKIIEEQMTTIRGNAAKIKSQRAESDQIERDNQNKKGKSNT